MNVTTLNMTTLDGGVIIKKGEGGGSAKPKWTGHADVEGLKAIGWTDEDIAYYQANGVNWNEEDDEWHKVSDDNKALYGVLTASNISTYKDRIVYLPKIDTSGKTSMKDMFNACHSLTSIPMLDTSKVTTMSGMFNDCYSLTSIPLLDTSIVTSMYNMVKKCYSLTSIPLFDTSKVTNMSGMFSHCYSLKTIPMLDTSKVSSMQEIFSGCHSLTSIPMLDTSKVTNMSGMFNGCESLTSIPMIDTSKANNPNNIFGNCYSLTYIPMLDTSNITNTYSFSSFYSLTHAYLKNVKLAYTLNYASLLSKDSLLYIINNEAATSAITITLASYAYDKWANDPDIVAALANHPNISLAK